MSGPVLQNDTVGPSSYNIDSTSPPYIGMRQQPIVNTAESETASGDQASACLTSPVLHMPDVRASSLSVVTSSSPTNISASASTCLTRDDEPLSTPPALDVPEEASRTFFPPAQMPILDNSAHPSANGGFTPSLALDACTSDIPFANQVAPLDVGGEQVQKKKRKRKSDNAVGEDGSSGTAKRSRKKKPKAADADVNAQVLPADSSHVLEGVPEVVDEAGVNIPATQPVTKAKKSSKDPSAPKTPKAPKVPKEKKTPKEPKTAKEPKSGKSKKSAKSIKPQEKSEDGDEVPPALEVVEISAEDDGMPVVTEEKPKPTPRPKSKKKRYDLFIIIYTISCIVRVNLRNSFTLAVEFLSWFLEYCSVSFHVLYVFVPENCPVVVI